MKRKLYDLAHARAGDKGNTTILSLIAYRAEDFPLLRAHVTPDAVIAAFDDLATAVEDCPRGCGHLGPPADPECALDALVAAGGSRPGRLGALRRVLVALRAAPPGAAPTER